jgi:hypothetical protein
MTGLAEGRLGNRCRPRNRARRRNRGRLRQKRLLPTDAPSRLEDVRTPQLIKPASPTCSHPA